MVESYSVIESQPAARPLPETPSSVDLALVESPAAPLLPTAKNPWTIKRLTQVHKDAITLSMQGLSREKVAEFCGRTPAWVTLVCKQPLAREYIAELEAHADLRLRGMYDKSLNVLDEVLAGAGTRADQLKAVDITFNALGKNKPGPDDGKQTAEDVVGAMLIQDSNVQVTINRSK